MQGGPTFHQVLGRHIDVLDRATIKHVAQAFDGVQATVSDSDGQNQAAAREVAYSRRGSFMTEIQREAL